MSEIQPHRTLWASALALATVAGVVFIVVPALPVVAGVIPYLLLAFGPGAAAYLVVAREPRRADLCLAALVISPVLTTSLTVVLMLLGVSPASAAPWLVVATGLVGGAVVLRRGQGWVRPASQRSHTVVLVTTVLLITIVVGYLPMSNEWWRTRADAVFHAAVIAQIRDFGLPPEDPYFIGFPLQYMWYYHVHVLLMAEASRFSPYFVMAFLNLQALWTLALAAFLLSRTLRPGFRYAYASALIALFGVNALFWLFLPVKAARALTGEVRGMEALASAFTLRPYDMFTISRFVNIGMNMEFLLDKFMVATATSVGLGMMGAAWYGCAAYLKERRRDALMLAFLASIGMMAFHTAIGVLSFGALVGGVVLLVFAKSRLQSFDTRSAIVLGVTLIAAFVVIWPYLHSVTQAKRSDQLLPFSLSLWKMLGIFISCALGVLLCAFQARRLLRSRDVADGFMVLATASIALICTIIRLPGTNTANKLPLLVFFPLAVVGGWTLVDWASRASTRRKQRVMLAVGLVAALAPLNVLALGAYYNTTPDPRRSNPFAAMNPQEARIAAWVGANTPRDAIFFDSGDRVFLIANGPRRYYMGNSIYAEGWGYDESVIAERRRLIDSLYSPEPLDPGALATLAALPADVFVVVRNDEPQNHGDKLANNPSLFHKVFATESIQVLRLDREEARKRSEGIGGSSE